MHHTGDMGNALGSLHSWLRKIRYSAGVDEERAREGHPEVFLPLIHYAVLGYSRTLARHLGRAGHDLYGKSDLKFIEGVYKVLRDEFKYSSKLNKAQFFSVAFAEQKMLLTADIIRLCHDKHKELTRETSNQGSPHRRHRRGPAVDSRGVVLPPELKEGYTDMGPTPPQERASWRSPLRPDEKQGSHTQQPDARVPAASSFGHSMPISSGEPRDRAGSDGHEAATAAARAAIATTAAAAAVAAASADHHHHHHLGNYRPSPLRDSHKITDASAPPVRYPRTYDDAGYDRREGTSQRLPAGAAAAAASGRSKHRNVNDDDEDQILSFYAPEDVDDDAGLNAVATWATHSLSAYSGDDRDELRYEVVRSDPHGSPRRPGGGGGHGGGGGGGAHGTGEDDTGDGEGGGAVAAVVASMSRLASCVETLSERIDRVEEVAVGGGGGGLLPRGQRHGDRVSRRRGAERDADGFAEEVLSAMHDMERRLLSAQEAFQDSVHQISARMMLMQQRLVAVETSQMQLSHHGGPTMYSEGPSHRLDDVPAAPPAMGDVMSMTADAMLAGTLSRLERSLGLDSAQSSQVHTPPEIQTPPRPGELSFRPPSTSSPRRRPISKLRPVDAREFP